MAVWRMFMSHDGCEILHQASVLLFVESEQKLGSETDIFENIENDLALITR